MPSKDYNDKSGLAYYWLEENVVRVLLVALFAGIGLWGLLLEGSTELNPIQKLARGMGPELAGIVLAAVTIEVLAERRQEAERKKILIGLLGSKNRDVTEAAIIELRNREWLYDGSLSGANLRNANLSGATIEKTNLSEAELKRTNLSGGNLWEANLSEANLSWANLSKADLRRSNLSRTDLEGANLSGARLWGADLTFARLWKADLSGTNLRSANLNRADFLGANLSGARYWTIEQLEQAKLDGATIPDGVQLGFKGHVFAKTIHGPTFEQWKEQLLATRQAREAENQDTGESNDLGSGQAESGSLEPS